MNCGELSQYKISHGEAMQVLKEILVGGIICLIKAHKPVPHSDEELKVIDKISDEEVQQL
ncbi:hypothetical protein HZS_1787, partial [Henneguya salminicola]